MIRVKTFTSEVKIFRTMAELNQLDEMVNKFLEEQNIQSVVSVSDTCTTDNAGATIGIVRVLTYETAG